MISLFSLFTMLIQTTLAVSSPAFTNNGNIPMKFSCEGNNVSPALHIERLPQGTVSLALIVHDPDAARPGGFTHWVAFNIDPTVNIPEGYQGGVQASNGAKKQGYTGPCPPTGTHHYHFKIYALDTRLSLDKYAGKEELEKAMVTHILGEGEIVGLYQKTK